MRIVLLGPKGVGKTTVGEELARRMGVPFVDTDWEMERLYQMSTRELFLKVGEERFREIELGVLSGVKSEGVIAVGGGGFLGEENREVLRGLGKLVCLYLDRESLRERWKGKPSVWGDFDRYYEERMESLRKLPCLWMDAKSDAVSLLLRAYGE